MQRKVINKSLMLTRKTENHSWQVEANIFETVKAQCLFDAKASASQYLPRFNIWFDTDGLPDLERWRMAFSSDNAPEEIVFRGRDQELAEAIRDVDFSKPFDETTAANIRAKFRKPTGKEPTVDADLIIQGELGELPEQRGKDTPHD